jgi:hypothetical protein
MKGNESMARWNGLIFVALLALSGCNRTHEPAEGGESETHWLTCVTTADCPGKQRCQAGRCMEAPSVSSVSSPADVATDETLGATGWLGGNSAPRPGGAGAFYYEESGSTGHWGTDPDCFCTRSATWPHSSCPKASGKSTTVTIGPEGGTLVLDDTPQTIATGVPVELSIPPGALSKATAITLTERLGTGPVTHIDYSPVYRIEPHRVFFDIPAELRVPWMNAVAPVDLEELVLYEDSAPGDTALAIASSADALFVRAPIEKGGWYFVGLPRTADTVNCLPQ